MGFMSRFSVENPTAGAGEVNRYFKIATVPVQPRFLERRQERQDAKSAKSKPIIYLIRFQVVNTRNQLRVCNAIRIRKLYFILSIGINLYYRANVVLLRAFGHETVGTQPHG